MSRRIRVVVLAVALLATPGAADAQATRPLAIGFHDAVFSDGAAAERGMWLDRTVQSGADVVRIDVGWPVAGGPVRPAAFDARDPGAAAYDFGRADAAITDAARRGLRILASFTGAPRWAEGPARPASAPDGSWRPDPAALADYGAALARRYSGVYPDPTRPGQVLPRVDAFQVWNEPNLERYLSPQWRGGRTFAPAHYRRMLTAFHRGVKSVRPAALVVTAGTAPFGDPQAGGKRIMPARFVRELLCLRRVGGRLRGASCPQPARFDVLAHHPYSVGFPRRRALNDDDVSIPDLAKLIGPLRAAERLGRALPRVRHRVWVTEVSYDSSPPDPDGVPTERHARFLSQTLYLLWRQGIDTIMWFQIRDAAPRPSFAATNQSGVFFADGRAKPAARAFRFPLFAQRIGRRTLVWGRSPLAGQVEIQRLTSSGWRTVRRVAVRRHATFLVRIPRSGTTDRVRASIASERSMSWVT